MQMNVQEILRDAKAKEDRAFELVRGTCCEILSSLITTCCLKRKVCENILQNLFVKTVDRIKSLDLENSFIDWSRPYVKNSAINCYKGILKIYLPFSLSNQMSVLCSNDFIAKIE
jgi:hypothetical protein